MIASHEPSGDPASRPAETGPQFRERVLIDLTVNGQRWRGEVPARRTLLAFLRDDLGLTGTKLGCDTGNCGACSVLVDGELVYSCLVLAASCDGRRVETIEGLSRGDALHPIQQAFLELDAYQCGFCTPGQIMAIKALLDRNPRPTREEAVAAVAGNLCRCGAYPRIVAAALRAAELMGGDGHEAAAAGDGDDGGGDGQRGRGEQGISTGNREQGGGEGGSS
ncbi:MAG TPA: (2Fe-2S)-binding protein [Thermaerobacter sp.]